MCGSLVREVVYHRWRPASLCVVVWSGKWCHGRGLEVSDCLTHFPCAMYQVPTQHKVTCTNNKGPSLLPHEVPVP